MLSLVNLFPPAGCEDVVTVVLFPLAGGEDAGGRGSCVCNAVAALPSYARVQFPSRHGWTRDLQGPLVHAIRQDLHFYKLVSKVPHVVSHYIHCINKLLKRIKFHTRRQLLKITLHFVGMMTEIVNVAKKIYCMINEIMTHTLYIIFYY